MSTITKDKLIDAVGSCKVETKEALQTVYDALNHGQQQKLLKEEKVKALFDRYDVEC